MAATIPNVSTAFAREIKKEEDKNHGIEQKQKTITDADFDKKDIKMRTIKEVIKILRRQI